MPIAASRLPFTRRAVLQALGLACLARLRPLAAGFTSITDEFAALMRWCSCGGPPRFAAA